MQAHRILFAVVILAGGLLPRSARATYSPPLTEVRIDEDLVVHYVSLVVANEQRTTSQTDLSLSGWGAQYLGQFEWSSGFGLQVGAAIGYADVDGAVGIRAAEGFGLDTTGVWLGGQLRAYQMLWKSTVDEEVRRPSAVTVFANLRSLYYRTSGQTDGVDAELEFFTLGGGLGAMAEWSISDYVSICPYAWVTPGVSSALNYSIGGRDFDSTAGFTFRNPLLVGIDLWVYPFPPNWHDHISLSFLGSFIDTEGDDQTVAVVLGYTF